MKPASAHKASLPAIRASAITALLFPVALIVSGAAHAGPGPRTVPPFPVIGISPAPGAVGRGISDNANPIDNPIAGARINGVLTGGQAPPSLAALQAARPPHPHGKPISPMRFNALHEAALSYGARGGLAAQSYAINLMLAKYQARLDQTFNFSRIVVAVRGEETLMVPPIVTEAQMAFALEPGGQTAKEIDRVYQITEEARLASAPPNWRSFLVRSWAKPAMPPADLLPRTPEEANDWTAWVADGWALGEQQGTQIFLDDLDRLETAYVGMLRYRVLLRDGLVEAPATAFSHQGVSGGRDRMLIGNQVIRITNQPGLDPNARRWRHPSLPFEGPIGQPPNP